VNKIKAEIWGDRLNFLQKMVKLADESKQDIQQAQDGQTAQTSAPEKKQSVVPQAQALAQ